MLCGYMPNSSYLIFDLSIYMYLVTCSTPATTVFNLLRVYDSVLDLRRCHDAFNLTVNRKR